MKDSKAKILDAAARLFAERGYSNVSVRDVCREAETTTPMIYYYFGDKRGLFASAVSHRISLQDFISRLREKTEVKDEVRSISAFIDTYLSSFPDHVFDMGLYMLDTAKLERKSAERISKDLDEVHTIATSIIERGVRSSRFATTDSSKAADCLIGMLNRVIFQRIHFARQSDMESSREFITGFFLNAMQPLSRGSA